MLTKFFSSLDYPIIVISLLGLLVFYVLVILHAKKYLNIVNKIVMILFAFPLYYLLHRIVTEPHALPELLSQFLLFAIIHFFVSLGGTLANIENFQFGSKNALKLSVLILTTYYLFNLIYLLFPWSDFSFGREGAMMIILPYFILLSMISSFVMALITTSLKLHLQIFLMMLFIFIGLMVVEKHNYDIGEQIKQEQWEAEERAEKLEEIRVEKANSKAEQVFKNLWNHEGTYLILEEKLQQVKNETKEIQIEKGAIALMLFLEDKQFKKFFEENKPQNIADMNSLGSILFKHYELKNEKSYLKLFSILETYSHDYGEPLYKFFHYHYKLFSFEKFVNKNYDEVAFIVLKHKNHIYSITIKEYLNNAKQISNKKIRDKAIMFILNEIDVYSGRTIENLPTTVINILDEENIDKYMKILIKKVFYFPYNSVEDWGGYNDDKVKKELIGMYNYLGKNHPLIKAFPKEMKEFYFKDIPVDRSSVNRENSRLQGYKWISESCREEKAFDQNGKVFYMYTQEEYHFTNENKIYVKEKSYRDRACKVQKNNNVNEYYVRYKELKSNGKDDELFSIRIEEFDSSMDSFAGYQKKDAYFSLKDNRLCFSKSIFVKNKVIPLYTNEGIQIGKQTLNGFGIIENESDEIDYEHCLGRID